MGGMFDAPKATKQYSLCARIDALCARIDALCAQIDALCAWIDAPCARIHALCTWIDALRAWVATLCAQIDALCAQIDALCAWIDSLCDYGYTLCAPGRTLGLRISSWRPPGAVPADSSVRKRVLADSCAEMHVFEVRKGIQISFWSLQRAPNELLEAPKGSE